MFGVVAVPEREWWAPALLAIAIATIALSAGVPFARYLRGVAVEIPFLAFVAFLPFVVRGTEVEVLGMGVSVDGMWAAFSIVTKATIGMATIVTLTATTEVTQVIAGLERLKVPRVLCAIAGSTLRYLDLITGEARRMAVARRSRGYAGRWIWQAGVVGAGIGTLFIRSLERGERVHHAMVSRGYRGSFPVGSGGSPPMRSWAAAAALPVLAWSTMLIARTL